MKDTHTCNEMDNEAFVIYRENGLVHSWVIDDVDSEDHLLYIWFCPFCGVKLNAE
ncbi:hypothetical protein LCGC14_2342730 [marine sediment metagenome]|uniref:Uncharacterized protein n=1 Tax=marine sediment metagenome TaxID=412755 RepID=A0A0F9CBE5_9ZZZZ